jgi:DnaK suppressor protein
MKKKSPRSQPKGKRKPAGRAAARKSAARPAKRPKPSKAPKGAKKTAKSAKKAAPAKPAPRAPKPAPRAVVTRRPLTKVQEAYRHALLTRQRELMQTYTATRGDSRDHLDSGTEDYIDYAVNSYAREFLLSLTEMDRNQLLMVEEALRRLDRGEFGRCQQCGTEIPTKRLEVAPWVRYCVRCQELEEQGLLPKPSLFEDRDEDMDETEDDAPLAGEEAFGAELEADDDEPVTDEALEVGDDEE